jgi:hypothetical protein
MQPSVSFQAAHDHVESAPTITWNERPRSAECAAKVSVRNTAPGTAVSVSHTQIAAVEDLAGAL